MILKILLKFWPAITPIALYILWIILRKVILGVAKRNNNIIDAEYEDLSKKNIKNNHFSLKNTQFLVVIYISLILLIISFLFFALERKENFDGKYIPATIKNGKILPSKLE